MFPAVSPVQTKSWQLLNGHFQEEMKEAQMKNLFRADPLRFNKFSLELNGMLFDYSKNIITEKTLALLIQLAKECQLEAAINAMFSGEKINRTEDRSVLHIALRNFSDRPIYSDGVDVMPAVKKVRAQMEEFCEKVHSGQWKGYTGKKIKYIVNIGIGGSDLGPVMVTEALKPYWVPGIEALFVSNVDGSDIAETLKKVTPDETIFLLLQKLLPPRKR